MWKQFLKYYSCVFVIILLFDSNKEEYVLLSSSL